MLLTAGGLIFGGALGTMLGGTGIIVSGLANFALARRLGDVMVPGEWRPRLRRLDGARLGAGADVRGPRDRAPGRSVARGAMDGRVLDDRGVDLPLGDRAGELRARGRARDVRLDAHGLGLAEPR